MLDIGCRFSSAGTLSVVVVVNVIDALGDKCVLF